jgi:hypothetical protein
MFPVVGYAISGKAGSGKSTLGRHLQDLLAQAGYSSCLTAFGTELKREVKELYGLDKTDPGGRAALITHGEQKRLENPRYWIDRCEEIVRGSRAQGYVCIIDDVRFPTEFDWARSLGFALVRLEAPPAVRARRLKADRNEPHIATSGEEGETALDQHLPSFDYVYWDDHGTSDLQLIAHELIGFELRIGESQHRRLLPEPWLNEKGEALGLPQFD